MSTDSHANSPEDVLAEAVELLDDRQSSFGERLYRLEQYLAGKSIDEKHAILEYAVKLRKRDSLSNKQGVIAELLKTARQNGIQVEYDEVIDYQARWNSNRLTPFQPDSETGPSSDPDPKPSYEFVSRSEVIDSAVEVIDDDNLNAEKRRAKLRRILETATEAGFDVTTEEIASAVDNNSHEDSTAAKDSDEETGTDTDPADGDVATTDTPTTEQAATDGAGTTQSAPAVTPTDPQATEATAEAAPSTTIDADTMTADPGGAEEDGEESQCIEIRSDGSRCPNDAMPGDIYCRECGDHEPTEDPNPEAESEDAAPDLDDAEESEPTPTGDEGDSVPAEPASSTEVVLEPDPQTKQEPTTEDDSEPTDEVAPELEMDAEPAASIGESGSDADDAVESPDADSTTDTAPRPEQSSFTPSAAREPEIDDDTDPIDKGPQETKDSEYDDVHTRQEERRGESGGIFDPPNFTQDLVDVEFVIEGDDGPTPQSVDEAGVIVTGEEEFAGIAKITPIPWKFLKPEERQLVINQYTDFLRKLDFPVQMVMYQNDFDVSEHMEAIKSRGAASDRRDDESPLLAASRGYYTEWLERFHEQNNIKRVDYYIVTRVRPEQLAQAFGQSSLLDVAVQIVPGLDSLRGLFSSTTAEADRERLISEVDERFTAISSGLGRMGIEVERVTDRDEVMAILYQFYNNEAPSVEAFATGSMTEVDSSKAKGGSPDEDALTKSTYDLDAPGGRSP